MMDCRILSAKLLSKPTQVNLNSGLGEQIAVNVNLKASVIINEN